MSTLHTTMFANDSTPPIHRVASFLHQKRGQVTHLEGTRNYTLIHVSNDKPAFYARTLIRVLEQTDNFVRIHKRYAVDLNWIEHCAYDPENRRSLVILKSGVALPISRRCWPPVEAALTRRGITIQNRHHKKA